MAGQDGERDTAGPAPSGSTTIDGSSAGAVPAAGTPGPVSPYGATISDATSSRPRPDDAGDPGNDDLIGRVVDRYRIVRRLGAGGMGVVFEAHDPALDRRVALKLLRHVDGDGQLEVRLRREAQALARLHHGNVIAVFDTGMSDAGAFVTMQLVDGESLDVILARGRLAWPRALELLTAAGRGLAAAHAAGIVHRDVKPSNILVDRDGTVRVGDFGLARAGVADDLPVRSSLTSSSSSLLEARMTRADAVLGTPRYMAPEQHRGEATTAQADQFAFCLTLYEAICGQHAFAVGRFEATAVLEAVDRGAVRPPPTGARLPRWLDRVIRRGLAAEPSRRWPSMDALLAALAPPPRRAWFAGAAAAAIVAGGTAAVVAAGSGDDPLATCRADAARADAVWPGREPALRAAVAATDHPGRAAVGDSIAGAVDGYTRQWRARRIGVCQAAARGDEPPAVRDARVACLDARLAAVGVAVDRFAARPSAKELDRAPAILAALPSLDDCDARSWLTPPPAAVAARVADLQARGYAAEMEAGAGDPAGAIRALEAMLVDAEATGYGPIIAGVLNELGGLLRDQDPDKAKADHERALELASRDHDEATATVALGGLVAIAAAKPDVARLDALVPVLRAAAARTGDPWQIAMAEVRLGTALLRAGRPDEAATTCVSALVHARELPADVDPTRQLAVASLRSQALSTLTSVSMSRGDLYTGLTYAAAAVENDERQFGVDTPGSATNLLNLAKVHWQLSHFDQALALLRRVAAVYQRAYPPGHPGHGDVARTEALIELDAGRPAEAIAAGRRALGVLGTGDSKAAAIVHGTLAKAHDQLGQRAESEAEFALGCPMMERVLGPAAPNLAVCLYDWGRAGVDNGDLAGGLVRLERAASIFEAAHSGQVPVVRVSIGAVLVKQHRYAEALPLLERALAALVADGEYPDGVMEARVELARGLWESKRDRPRARALVAQVRADAAAAGADDPAAAEARTTADALLAAWR